MKVVYYRSTPGVLIAGKTTSVVLEVKVEGAPSSVVLTLLPSKQQVQLKDDGTGGDKKKGDGIFSVTLPAAELTKNFSVNRKLVGQLTLHTGSQVVAGPYLLDVDVLTDDIPPVKITKVASDTQFSEHLVNIVAPVFLNASEGEFPKPVMELAKKFYSRFDDDYDFLNIIYEFTYFRNRGHFRVRNDVKNIGSPIFDQSSQYGSAGRLLGWTVFPIPTLFDGASKGYLHETGHQWVNHLPAPFSAPGTHWPLSDLASCIMGWSISGQGLEFNFDLKPAGQDFELVPNNGPKVFSDASLYLMGFIPPAQVKEHFIFKDQSKELKAGAVLKANEVTKFSIKDVIAAVKGVRQPDASQSQKKFRAATIIVSKDGLLPESVMRFYDHFAARAEATTIVLTQEGLAKPFHLATQGLGRLDTRIKRRILVDASRDGGVWWFPQQVPYNPNQEHQGKNLADHLRSLLHQVDELSPPAKITAKQLAGYDIVIRAGALGKYDQTEIAAYMNYIKGGGNLLLLSDAAPPDNLMTSLGIKFEGVTRGENLLTNFTPHPITKGVGALPYMIGGGLTQIPPTAKILGKLSAKSFLDLNGNGIQDPGEPVGVPVFGAMPFGAGRVVFCGDTNLWETVPQPLTKNVLKWFTSP